MIEGIVARIKQEYEEPMLCIATGGLARFYEQATDMIEYLDEDLTIQGLIAIHELNS
jgi:type III pantothenate kinase